MAAKIMSNTVNAMWSIPMWCSMKYSCYSIEKKIIYYIYYFLFN